MPIVGPYSQEETQPFDILDFLRRKRLRDILGVMPERDAGVAAGSITSGAQSQVASEPNSATQLRQIVDEAPRIEDYKPSRFRSIMGAISGLGTGLATMNPQAAQQARQSVEYEPFNKQQGIFGERLKRAQTIYDLDTGIQKSRSEIEQGSARTAAERAREASERAQQTKAERETQILPGSFEQAHEAEMEKVRAQHPDATKQTMEIDKERGMYMIFDPKSGNVTITQYADPAKANANDPTSYREYQIAKQQFEQANAGKAYMSYDDWLTKDANRKRPTTSISLGGMSNQDANRFATIVNRYNTSPLIRAADRTAVLQGSIQKVRANPRDGAGQLELAYSWIQALDTYQSAVREGELRLTGEQQSMIEQLSNLFQKVTNGQIQNPDAILRMATSAEQLVQTIHTAASQKAQSFQAEAEVQGLGSQWQQYIQKSKPSYQATPQAQPQVERYERGPDGKLRRVNAPTN